MKSAKKSSYVVNILSRDHGKPDIQVGNDILILFTAYYILYICFALLAYCFDYPFQFPGDAKLIEMLIHVFLMCH